MIKLEGNIVYLSGQWQLVNYPVIDAALKNLPLPDKPITEIIINGQALESLDTSGGYELLSWQHQLTTKNIHVIRQGFTEKQESLLLFLTQRMQDVADEPKDTSSQGRIEQLGGAVLRFLDQSAAFIAFIGAVVSALSKYILIPWKLRWRPLLSNIQTGGVDALLIVGLLNFLIGIVIAYQSGALLRLYGANIFIVEVVTIAMVREMAPLITAIIVAGRTGSAYAAQIGTMGVNQEVDALRTLGISPIDQLVLPKMLALMLVLPLLTMFGNILSVFGGMVLARFFLDVTFFEFIQRIPQVVSFSSVLVGLSKAPVFAILISLTGCYQGFQVQGGADSVGKQTTIAVVQAIFLVILADALFSVITRNIGI